MEKMITAVGGPFPQQVDPATTRVEIVKWMLKLHAGLAVYSRLGDSGQYYIIDALANEACVSSELSG